MALISREHAAADLVSGTVVFLVALPLCLGVALASGAPLISGVIAGVVGGMVVTLVSRSALGVSGPAAGLTVIVLVAIQDLGFKAFLLAVVLSGVLQVAAGYLRAGIIGYYFPSSVVKGMLAGIGIILVLKQIPHALGYAATYEGDLQFAEADGGNSLTEIAAALSQLAPGALLIALVSLAILLAWERPAIRRRPRLAAIPAPLLVVSAGVVSNEAFGLLAPAWHLAGEQLVALPTPASPSEWFDLLAFPDFGALAEQQVYVVAFTLAVVGSLETLLSVEAVDKIDPDRRVTPTSLELKAQGIGNMVSGLLGGLPVTQVIVRSAANVQGGGRTRFASFVHGGLLLLCVMLIPGVLNRIPLACLAGILLVTGYKLAKVSVFREMARLGWWQFVPFLVTVVGLVLTDMLTGIALGMVVGVFHILKAHYRTGSLTETLEGGHYRLVLAEHMSFLHKASVMRDLSSLPDGSTVTIDGSRCVLADHDVREVIQEFVRGAPGRGIEVRLENLDRVKILGSGRPAV
ncbi:MAG: SulP family inorganic anion transporter [Deltaproteobacteria bacterium]|nr:SulP family inorganic anion transporter [Deltaproteobacteria bacterium]